MTLASSVGCGLRYGVFGLVAVAGLTIVTKSATAGNHDIGHKTRATHSTPADSSSPLGSSIVVDGNTGLTLEASKPNALRHPASLTKIMTLYLLFERIEQRTIGLDTQLRVSENAASQAPTKLGLKAGQTIAVEDAIKAMVTKSANDAAVTVAENLGGDEGEFAKLMTHKAHALGMSHTTYVNASGLPDDNQITTAQDQALLGRAIQERFPRYYKYFSTKEFVYRGIAMRNHNHLLGVVGGVDGIKTGYTRSSGFNLVTSVHRDGRYIVAVVLGGHTASERDARMRELIDAAPYRARHRRQAGSGAEPEQRAAEAGRIRQGVRGIIVVANRPRVERPDRQCRPGHRGRSHSTPVGEDDHVSVCARPRCGGGDVGHSRSLTVCRRLTV
jgi:D-alanyl-D-alanine carboxypeptidase